MMYYKQSSKPSQKKNPEKILISQQGPHLRLATATYMDIFDLGGGIKCVQGLQATTETTKKFRHDMSRIL